jgi:hypothetical protein
MSLFPIVYEKMIAVEKLSCGDAVEEERDVFTHDLDVHAQTSAGDRRHGREMEDGGGRERVRFSRREV